MATKKKLAKKKARQKKIKKQLNLKRVHGEGCPCCIEESNVGDIKGEEILIRDSL